MKKTLFEESVSGSCCLYAGIDSVYGEFILDTGGDPITLNDLQEANNLGCDDIIQKINNVISDPNTYWEPCDCEDEQYISEWLNIWGIDHD